VGAMRGIFDKIRLYAVKRPGAKSLLLAAGLLCFLLSVILLSPSGDLPPEAVIERAHLGIYSSVMGGLLILLWIWKR